MAKGKKNNEQTLRGYLWLLGVLYETNYKKLSLKEISALWQANAELSNGEPLSRDTFNKRRKAIEKIFDLKIVCNKSTKTYHILSDYNDYEIGFEAVCKEMINAIAIKNLISDNRKLGMRIQYGESINGNKLIIPILNAIKDKRTITIFQINFETNALQQRMFNPLFLKSVKQRWYVFGCHYKGNEDCFALDCIKTIFPTNRRFRYDFTNIESFISQYFNQNLIPISSDHLETVVKLKIYGGLVGHVKTFPLHQTQTCDGTNIGYTLFSYRLIPDDIFIGELLRHGDRIEVIEPKYLRDKVITCIDQMQKRYTYFP